MVSVGFQVESLRSSLHTHSTDFVETKLRPQENHRRGRRRQNQGLGLRLVPRLGFRLGRVGKESDDNEYSSR